MLYRAWDSPAGGPCGSSFASYPKYESCDLPHPMIVRESPDDFSKNSNSWRILQNRVSRHYCILLSSMPLTGDDDALASLQVRLEQALSDGTETQCQGLLDWSMFA